MTILLNRLLNGRPYLLSTSATVTTPDPTPTPTPTPTPFNDGYTFGIYYPSQVSIAQHANAFIPICSGFARFASNLPQGWFLTGADASSFSLGGANGSTLISGYTSYQVSNRSSFAVTVNVTDGITTYSQAVTIQNPLDAIYFGSNVLLDTASTDYAHFYGVENGVLNTALSGGAAATIVDPTGTFQINPNEGSNGLIAAAATPISSHYGAKSGVTLSGGGLSLTEPMWVIAEQPAYVAIQSAGTIYSNLQPGDLLGTIVAYSDAGINVGGNGLALISSDGTITMGSTGALRVAAGQALTAGSKSLTVRITSKSGKVTTETLAYTVAAGTMLNASAMTMAVATGLDNYQFGQAIGTPTVAGMSGPITWTISNPDDTFTQYMGDQSDAQQVPLRLFSINPSTGAVSGTAGQQLSATSPNTRPDTGAVFDRPPHQITLTAVSGSVMCRRTFSVPVAWKSGPTLHVGQGMASAYPGTGYEHWTDLMPSFMPVDIGAMAGAVINVHYNSDPNYFANDGVSGHETFGTNYALRYELHGPFIFRNAATSGNRPRMGGAIGSVSGGMDPSGNYSKGYLTINSGDCIIDGIEMSFVQGFGSPDSDTSHGVSGIRKDADTWGDFTVLNSNVHDCNNDIKAGNGPYYTIVKNCVLTNFGAQYVSSGATHGLYNGECTKVIFTGNMVYHGTNGHGIKTRAKSGVIIGNTIIDGERGCLSNCIDIPEEGDYIVSNNMLQKGPNAQNPYVIQYGEEQYPNQYGQLYRKNNLVVSGNTIVILCPSGNHWDYNGGQVGVSVGGCTSAIDGTGTTATLTNNSYFFSTPYHQKSAPSPYGFATPTSLTETGAIMLTSLPTISLADPSPYTPAVRPSWFEYTLDMSGNFPNSAGVQVDPGVDLPITISHTASPGAVIANCTAYGTPLFANVSPTDPRINPFASGATWSLPQDPQWDGVTVPWAAPGRYAISASTGQITLVGSAPALGVTDFILARDTAANGTKVDWRISVTGS